MCVLSAAETCQISRALRNVLTKDLLDCARREHRNWCWNYVRAIREKERQNAVVNLTDIRRYDPQTTSKLEGAHGVIDRLSRPRVFA